MRNSVAEYIISLYINVLERGPECEGGERSGELGLWSVAPGPLSEFPDCLYRVPTVAWTEIVQEFQDSSVCEFAKT